MGLLRMAARTAVVAGTATAVSGRVARRQNEKYAAEDQQAYEHEQYQQQQAQQQYAPPPPAAAPPADDATAQLQNLAQLHQQGVLTDEEFASAKAKILGI
jgi:membrane protease subunit (stomatin/prohibitin family)